MNHSSVNSLLRSVPRRLDPFLGLVLTGCALAGVVAVLATSQILIGIAVIGAIALLIFLLDLDLGLFALILLTFTSAFDIGEKDHGIQSVRLLFVAFLLLAVFFSQTDSNPSSKMTISPTFTLFIAYGALLLASTIWAKNPNIAISATLSFAKNVLVGAAVMALMRTTRATKRAVWALILSGLVLGGISAFQYLTGTFDNTYLGFAKAPLRNIAGSVEGPRAAGPLGDPNAFAQSMVIVFPLALERFRNEKSRHLRTIALAAGGLSGLAVILSLSRGGLISLAVVAMLVLLRFPPGRSVALTAVACLVVVTAVAPEGYLSRILKIGQVFSDSPREPGDPAIEGRYLQMKIGLLMFRDYPVAGVGIGNFPARFDEYNRDFGLPSSLGRSPHNLFIEIAAESGIIGLALWGAIVISAFKRLKKARQHAQERSPDSPGLYDALTVALIAFLVNSMFLHGAYPMPQLLLLSIALSVPLADDSARTGDEPVRSEAPRAGAAL